MMTLQVLLWRTGPDSSGETLLRLKQEDKLRVETGSGNCDRLRHTLRTSPSDVVVLQGQLDPTFTERLRRVRQQNENAPPVILMTGEEEIAGFPLLLEAGVRGLVSRNASAQTLIRAIRVVHAGKRYIDPAFSNELIRHYIQNTDRSE